MFQPGALRDLVKQRTAEALAAGELKPIVTRSEYIDEDGVRFLVRIVSGGKPKLPPSGTPGAATSPFLNRDDALQVAEVSPTHVCRLNRYPVVEDHTLIVTRQFEDQQAPLNAGDFHALWTCMNEYEAMAFYNGGPAAGASQSHKHLQMVPLPLAPAGPRIPLEPLIAQAKFSSAIGESPRLPFRHGVARLDPQSVEEPAQAAQASLALYRELLSHAGIDPHASALEAYNLLATREWMLIVPRVREWFDSVSLNGLAFAGTLLVKSEEQFALLRNRGAMAALQSVAGQQRTRP
jgi:ATP adenylyltransferase